MKPRLLAAAVLLSACAAAAPAGPGPASSIEAPALPPPLAGKAVILAVADADYARAVLAEAMKPAGGGGIIQGRALVVRLTADVPLWRLWSGPSKKDPQGNTNRLGQWWSYDAPRGALSAYRKSYEICTRWNDLAWVARCTLHRGAVIAIGPGNSVSAATCEDATGQESYPENPRDWQVWLAKAWTRCGPDKELECPPESEDYEPSAEDISQARSAPLRSGLRPSLPPLRGGVGTAGPS